MFYFYLNFTYLQKNFNFFKKCIDIYKKILYTLNCVEKCSLSSVGQSNRLITGGSKVQILEGAPFLNLIIWVGGRVAKGGRLWSLVYQKPKLAAHISDYMMNTGLIRGTLNSKADDNPELGKKFPSVETLYLVS